MQTSKSLSLGDSTIEQPDKASLSLKGIDCPTCRMLLDNSLPLIKRPNVRLPQPGLPMDHPSNKPEVVSCFRFCIGENRKDILDEHQHPITMESLQKHFALPSQLVFINAQLKHADLVKAINTAHLGMSEHNNILLNDRFARLNEALSFCTLKFYSDTMKAITDLKLCFNATTNSATAAHFTHYLVLLDNLALNIHEELIEHKEDNHLRSPGFHAQSIGRDSFAMIAQAKQDIYRLGLQRFQETFSDRLEHFNLRFPIEFNPQTIVTQHKQQPQLGQFLSWIFQPPQHSISAEKHLSLQDEMVTVFKTYAKHPARVTHAWLQERMTHFLQDETTTEDLAKELIGTPVQKRMLAARLIELKNQLRKRPN